MFKIKIKKSSLLGKYDEDDECVDEAISTIYKDYENFQFEICFALSNASNIEILLDFRGDMSEIYTDIVKMVKMIILDTNTFKIHFLSSSFTAIWEFSLDEKSISLKPKWTTANLLFNNSKINPSDYAKYENLIKIDKYEFLNEWNKLLKGIFKDLVEVGYNDSLNGFMDLKMLLGL